MPDRLARGDLGRGESPLRECQQSQAVPGRSGGRGQLHGLAEVSERLVEPAQDPVRLPQIRPQLGRLRPHGHRPLEQGDRLAHTRLVEEQDAQSFEGRGRVRVRPQEFSVEGLGLGLPPA